MSVSAIALHLEGCWFDSRFTIGLYASTLAALLSVGSQRRLQSKVF